MKITPLVLTLCSLVLSSASLRANEPPDTTFVRGFVGEATGGFRESWHSHLGDVPFSGVRKNKELGQMEWKSAPVPEKIDSSTVTFVWAGALGIDPTNRGDF